MPNCLVIALDIDPLTPIGFLCLKSTVLHILLNISKFGTFDLRNVAIFGTYDNLLSNDGVVLLSSIKTRQEKGLQS